MLHNHVYRQNQLFVLNKFCQQDFICNLHNLFSNLCCRCRALLLRCRRNSPVRGGGYKIPCCQICPSLKQNGQLHCFIVEYTAQLSSTLIQRSSKVHAINILCGSQLYHLHRLDVVMKYRLICEWVFIDLQWPERQNIIYYYIYLILNQ